LCRNGGSEVKGLGVRAKICGLKTAEAVDAAVAGGAAFAGFVFYPPSPRFLTAGDAAALIARLPGHVAAVGLFVDADDAAIAAVLAAAPLAMLQLHGHESPARITEIRSRFGLPVMRVLPISGATDLDAVDDYAPVSDWLMFDTRPPATPGALPGGNALAFDWRLLAGRRVPRPWMLAGGLDADNVGEAVRISGAAVVDVSSGVERARGVKDPARISAFLAAARSAGN
jgi:phosphoribosylanthranilate isomerase